jgi:hypothetical protein
MNRAMLAQLPTPDDDAVHVTVGPDVVALFWVENVAIMAWRGHATPAVVEELFELSKAQRQRFPSGMSCIHVGRAQLALMDSETRDVFVRVTRELSGYIAATALVTHASGFMASTLRSIATVCWCCRARCTRSRSTNAATSC